MAAAGETMTLSLLLGLINFQSVYFVGYAWLLGTTIWVTCFSGKIAFKALPRHQFGALQHRLFPVYFVNSLVLSTVLLGLWTYSHAGILARIWSLTVADVVQFYALAIPVISSASNWLRVGPLVHKTVVQRYKLEKVEGKIYNEPGISEEMKALNRRFDLYHAISVSINMASLVALVFHGLWIGSYGVVV
ncbi:hypothetical protein B0H21DRAFT_737751 [Amylocystis lapponica]|nr:hypothetical protein B0H21DRAFT_737751 [Amylocystis lapponica]